MFNDWPGQYRYISGGGSKSKSRPVRVSMYSPEQEAVFGALGSQIQPVQQIPSYPGAMSVPRTPEEEAYFGAVPQIASDIGTMRTNLGQPAFNINPATTEQYYQESIKAPMMKEWGEVVEPQIRESFVGPGYWGSARAEAQVKGAENLATTLGSKRAELYYIDELARRSAEEAAAGREATYGTTFAGAQTETLGTAGQYARQIEQEKVMGDLQRWLSGETVEGVTPAQYNPFLQLAFQFLGLDPYALGQKESSSSWSGGISY